MQTFDIISWEKLDHWEVEAVPSAPVLTENRWYWLQRLGLWLMRRAGWEGYSRSYVCHANYVTVPRDVSNVLTALDLQISEVTSLLRRGERCHIYIGTRQIRDLVLDRRLDQPWLTGVIDGMHAVFGHEAEPGAERKIWGVPVTALPNLDGVIVVPVVEGNDELPEGCPEPRVLKPDPLMPLGELSYGHAEPASFVFNSYRKD